jgi:hypothetical protein
MQSADSLRSRPGRNGPEPVDEPERRRDETADDAPDNDPIRDQGEGRVVGSEKDDVEEHPGREQAERKCHEHLMNRMAEKRRLTLHDRLHRCCTELCQAIAVPPHY